MPLLEGFERSWQFRACKRFNVSHRSPAKFWSERKHNINQKQNSKMYIFFDKPVWKDRLTRAVKKFLSSRLIMKSRLLWNLHQRHKFLRAEAARDILKFWVTEMAFSGVFKRHFPPWTPCCFVRIHTRLGTMPSKCPRCSKTSRSLHGSQI